MTNTSEGKEIYIVREINNSEDPAEKGEEVKRFRGKNGYEEARTFSDNMWIEDKIKTYISEEF